MIRTVVKKIFKYGESAAKKGVGGKKGLTFLELMITCGVIVIALGGLLATYANCLALNETIKQSSLALNAAQQVLEEIRSSEFLSIYAGYDGYTFSVPGMVSGDSLGLVSIDNTNPDLLEVNIGVCWRQRAGRIIGECSGPGPLVFADTDSDGILDSPIFLTTEMTQR